MLPEAKKLACFLVRFGTSATLPVRKAIYGVQGWADARGASSKVYSTASRSRGGEGMRSLMLPWTGRLFNTTGVA